MPMKRLCYMDEIGEQTSSRRGSLHCRRVFADEVDFRSTRAASGKWPEIPPPGKTAARLEPRRQSGFAAAAKRFCRGGKAFLPRRQSGFAAAAKRFCRG